MRPPNASPARTALPAAHFQPNPLGRGQLLFFRVARSARPAPFIMSAAKAPNSWRKMVLDGRFARALKNSQLTGGETKGI